MVGYICISLKTRPQ